MDLLKGNLVCSRDRNLSGSSEEQERRPERHHEERDVPPKGRSDVRAVFSYAGENTISWRKPRSERLTDRGIRALTDDHPGDEDDLVGDGGARPQQPQATVGLPTIKKPKKLSSNGHMRG